MSKVASGENVSQVKQKGRHVWLNFLGRSPGERTPTCIQVYCYVSQIEIWCRLFMYSLLCSIFMKLDTPQSSIFGNPNMAPQRDNLSLLWIFSFKFHCQKWSVKRYSISLNCFQPSKSLCVHLQIWMFPASVPAAMRA